MVTRRNKPTPDESFDEQFRKHRDQWCDEHHCDWKAAENANTLVSVVRCSKYLAGFARERCRWFHIPDWEDVATRVLEHLEKSLAKGNKFVVWEDNVSGFWRTAIDRSIPRVTKKMQLPSDFSDNPNNPQSRENPGQGDDEDVHERLYKVREVASRVLPERQRLVFLMKFDSAGMKWIEIARALGEISENVADDETKRAIGRARRTYNRAVNKIKSELGEWR